MKKGTIYFGLLYIAICASVLAIEKLLSSFRTGLLEETIRVAISKAKGEKNVNKRQTSRA